MTTNKNGYYKMLISGTVIRLAISLSKYTLNILDTNKGIMMLYDKSIQAVLIDPFYSLTNVREVCHLSKLYVNGLLTLQSHCDDAQFRKQPILIYAFLDKVMDTIASIVPWDLDIVFVIGSIIIDLLTAIKLFHLANDALRIYSKNGIVDQLLWEQKLERFMHPRIHPPFAFIFGMEFGNDFQEDGDDIDQPSGNTNATNSPTTTSSSGKESEKNNDIDEIIEHVVKEPLCTLSDIPLLCSTLYYLNPINILATSAYASFQVIQSLLLVTAFQQVTSLTIDKEFHQQILMIIKSSLCLAILTNLELHHIVFLSPLVWCTKNYSSGMLWCKYKIHIFILYSCFDMFLMHQPI
jgi:hypothetical protein